MLQINAALAKRLDELRPELRNRRMELLVVLLLCATGAILALEPSLATDNHALGPHALVLLVPFAAGLVCLAYAVLTGSGRAVFLLAPLIVCVLLSALLVNALFQPIEHYRGDDPWRYSLYANHMLAEGTLWGSDGVYYNRSERNFVDQPGYRYYLAGMIWLSGGENRLMQLLNLLILLAALCLGVAALQRLDTPLARFTSLILFLSAPYAAKNAVQGLSEWLAVSMVLLYLASVLRGRDLLAISLLALAPFIRQDFIPIALLLAAVQIATTRRWTLILPFALIFCLPVYHNLYYAGDPGLLVENKGTMFDDDAPPLEMLSNVVQVILLKLPTYTGIPRDEIDPHTIAAAVLFAPAALVGIIYFVARESVSGALVRIAALAVVAGPTLVFGGFAYFPRFVYTGHVVSLLSFTALWFLLPSFHRDGRRA